MVGYTDLTENSTNILVIKPWVVYGTFARSYSVRSILKDCGVLTVFPHVYSNHRRRYSLCKILFNTIAFSIFWARFVASQVRALHAPTKDSSVVVNFKLDVPTVTVNLKFPILIQVSAVIIELEDAQIIVSIWLPAMNMQLPHNDFSVKVSTLVLEIISLTIACPM